MNKYLLIRHLDYTTRCGKILTIETKEYITSESYNFSKDKKYLIFNKNTKITNSYDISTYYKKWILKEL